MRRLPAALVLITSLLYIPFATPVLGGQLEDAKAAYERGDYEMAYRLIKPLAKKGIPDAQFLFGQMYISGQGVPQDDTEAVKWLVKWFRNAAEKGYAPAQNNLGIMYDKGKGVPQDYTEAMKWYRKAAEQGEASAMSNLSKLYYEGQGVPQDYVLAHMWSNLAASRFPASEEDRRMKAVRNRDIIASKMTPAQIAEAERLASEWNPKKEGR